jgi:polysaccharide biosynthesis/export protein
MLARRLLPTVVRRGFPKLPISIKTPRLLLAAAALLLALISAAPPVLAQLQEYHIGPGDILKITVFKSPDLTLDARVSEVGTISYPLLGSVQVSDLTLPAAEKKIGQLLKEGGFVVNPQVNILLTQAFGNLVSVLGEVNKPGRYPLDAAGGHLSGMLATAGGVTPTGADVAIVTGIRAGKAFRREIDFVKASLDANTTEDIALAGGDTVYVNRQQIFYIYGEVQHAGQFRLEKDMTVMQALAVGGGVTTTARSMRSTSSSTTT